MDGRSGSPIEGRSQDVASSRIRQDPRAVDRRSLLRMTLGGSVAGFALDGLVDVPPESVVTPLERLAEAFPGSKLLDERP